MMNKPLTLITLSVLLLMLFAPLAFAWGAGGEGPGVGGSPGGEGPSGGPPGSDPGNDNAGGGGGYSPPGNPGNNGGSPNNGNNGGGGNQPPPNNPPVFVGLGNQVVAEGQTLTFTVSASDADGDSVTISASNLPSGATFVNNVFTWTPDFDQAGNHQVTFTVSDGEDTTSQTITITVTNTNRAPILGAVGDFVLKVGETIRKLITATDPDGDSVTISASGLPDGASFNNDEFSFTPDEDQVGRHQVTFTASDGQLTDSEAFTIRVRDNLDDGPDVERLVVHTVAFPEGEQVRAGEELRVLVNLKNEFREELDDVRVKAYLMDYGEVIESNEFDFDSSYYESRVLRFPIPSHLEPGTYYLGFTVSSDGATRVKYRPIEVI